MFYFYFFFVPITKYGVDKTTKNIYQNTKEQKKEINALKWFFID